MIVTLAVPRGNMKTVPLLMAASIVCGCLSQNMPSAKSDPGDVKEITATVRRLLDDSTSDVTQEIERLGGVTQAVTKVAAYIRQGKHSEKETQAAITLLVYAQDKTGIPILISLAESKSETIRCSAVHLLGDEMCCDPRATDVFLAVLKRKKESQRIRIEAIYGLGYMRESRGVEPLIAELRNRDEEISQAAQWALAEINDPKTVGLLAPLLKNDDVRVREVVTSLIGDLKKATKGQANNEGEELNKELKATSDPAP